MTKKINKSGDLKKQSAALLSGVLVEVKKKTHQRLVEWIKENYAGDLGQWALGAIELKEDYERALFVRLGYQFTDKDWENAIDAMAALELLDSSLLIVDDIIDDAERRMGKKTIHRAWGIGNAIMLANMLKSTSILALLSSTKANRLTYKELASILSFNETIYNDMYTGEYLDLHYESLTFENISISDYLEMIRRTTGIHFGMAIKIGGMLSKKAKDHLRILWEIGVRAGMILQIRDDFIDYLDLEHITHKPAFGDFKRNKKRLPLILAFQLFPEKVKKLQNMPFDNLAVGEVQSLISHPRIRSKCLAIIENIYANTDSLVSIIKPTSVRKILSEFFYLIRRI